MQVENPAQPLTQESQLNEFIATVMGSKRLIAGIILLSMLVGLIYVVVAQPVYQADVMFKVEEKERRPTERRDLTERLQEKAAAGDVSEILMTRMVLGPVVENLKLDISTGPIHFPIIGNIIFRILGSTAAVSGPWFGLNQYAWGGERIRVEHFDTPLLYQGETFTIVAGKNGHYQLLDPEGTLLTDGVVNKPLKISVGEEEEIQLLVSELRSNPGTQFKLVKKARLAAINQLKDSLLITQQDEESTILKMSLEGKNRKKITTTLNEIASTYLLLSKERKSAAAEKNLLLLAKQLPRVKKKLEQAEAGLNKYRQQSGSIDLPLETAATLNKMVSIDTQLTQLRKDRQDLLQRFTPAHPRIAGLDAQIATLQREIALIDNKLDVLPGTQQEILRLTREVEVNSALYMELLNTAQEMKFVQIGAIANVDVLDYALMPNKPVKPKKGFVIALSIILGALFGIGIAFIRESLRGAVQDPEVIEKRFGIPVYATVPHSKKQTELDKEAKSKGGRHSVLAAIDTNDLSIESLRSLRTSLFFAKLDATNDSIMVTSPAASAGKSFISVNLAAVLANSGKRTLLVDADMRKGTIQNYFGIPRVLGLSDIIAKGVQINKAIYKTDITNLDIMPSGTIPPNPSELLLHRRFALLLEKVFEHYEHIIIDTPPVLAVTDAAIIGRLAGATLLVVKDGQSPLREIEQCIKRMQHAGVNLRGAVFNDISLSSSRYGYGKYYGHSYAYSYSPKK